MHGLQANHTWRLLALQPLVLMSHEGQKVHLHICDNSCLLGMEKESLDAALCLLCSTFIIDCIHASP